MMRTSAQNILMSIILISFFTHISIIFVNLMIALLMIDEKIVIKIKIQDLCSNNNLILKNILYFLLIQIASKNLDFKSQS